MVKRVAEEKVEVEVRPGGGGGETGGGGGETGGGGGDPPPVSGDTGPPEEPPPPQPERVNTVIKTISELRVAMAGLNFIL